MKKALFFIGILCALYTYTVMPMDMDRNDDWEYSSIQPIEKHEVNDFIQNRGHAVLKTLDDTYYACQPSIVKYSKTIKNLLKEHATEVIPLPTINDQEFETVAKILCKITKDGTYNLSPLSKDIIKEIYQDIDNYNFNLTTLSTLIVDVNYLDIKVLLQPTRALLCKKISELEVLFPTEVSKDKVIAGLFNKYIATFLSKKKNIDKFIHQKTIQGDQAPRSVNFYGKEFWVGFDEGTLQSYDLNNQEAKNRKKYDNCEYINSIESIPEHTSIVWGGKRIDGDRSLLRIINLANRQGSNFPSFNNQIKAIAKSPDGTSLAVASGHSIVLFDLSNKKTLLVCRGHQGVVRALAFIPSKKILASGSEDNTIRLWDITPENIGEGRVANQLKVVDGHTNWVTALICDPSGKMLISASVDQSIRVWNLDTDQVLLLHTIENQGWVKSLVWRPYGNLLYGASKNKKGKVTVFNLKKKKEVQTIEDHDHGLYTVTASPDGRTMISTGVDNTIKVYKRPNLDGLTIHEVQVLSWKLDKKKNLPEGADAVYENLKKEKLELLKTIGLEN